jgi:hypothetical protein
MERQIRTGREQKAISWMMCSVVVMRRLYRVAGAGVKRQASYELMRLLA